MRVCERVLDRRVIVVLVVTFAVSLGWASIAHAQAPFDVQYGSPTDSVGEISGIGGVEGAPEAGAAGLVGVSESRGEAAERPGATAPQEDRAESAGVAAAQGVAAEGVAAQGSAAAEGAAPPAAEQGAVAAIGLLPDTGGPLLVFAAVVVAALSGLGLLAIRRIGRS